MQKTDLLNHSEKRQDKVSRLRGCVVWKADSCAEKGVRMESPGTIDLKHETNLLTSEAEPSFGVTDCLHFPIEAVFQRGDGKQIFRMCVHHL